MSNEQHGTGHGARGVRVLDARRSRATSATHVVAHRGRRLCRGRWRGYRRPMASRPLREASAEWGDFVEAQAREQIAWAHLLYR